MTPEAAEIHARLLERGINLIDRFDLLETAADEIRAERKRGETTTKAVALAAILLEREQVIQLIECFFENDPAEEHYRIHELVDQIRARSK